MGQDHRAYDASPLRALLAAVNMEAVTPAKRNRKVPMTHDTVRNRIERCFNKLKHFQRIATRFDRRNIYFLSFLHLACTLLWLR